MYGVMIDAAFTWKYDSTVPAGEHLLRAKVPGMPIEKWFDITFYERAFVFAFPVQEHGKCKKRTWKSQSILRCRIDMRQDTYCQQTSMASYCNGTRACTHGQACRSVVI
jgi:hypothetical protein